MSFRTMGAGCPPIMLCGSIRIYFKHSAEARGHSNPLLRFGLISTIIGSYFGYFWRFAQYAFILRDCALRAAALIPPRRFFGERRASALGGFFGGRPRRFVPWSSAIARLSLLRSATRRAMM